MELWRGLHQSTVMGNKSLYVNADVLNKAVASEITVLNWLKLLNPRDSRIPTSLQPWQADKLKDHLQMMKICFQRKGVDMKFKQFLRLGKPASEQKFTLDGKQVTVEKYFKDKLNITLEYPQLPTIQVLPNDKNIFLPMEFCTIPGGQLNQKKFESREMIKQTAVATDARKAMIKNFSQICPPNDDMNKFGIEIGKEFEKVMSRILGQPSIVQGGNVRQQVKPNNGTWNDGKFVKAAAQQVEYAIINCDDKVSPQVLRDLKNDVNRTALQKGMQLVDAPGAEYSFRDGRGGDEALKKFLREKIAHCDKLGFGLVFVIVSEMNHSYALAKKIAETEVGVLTQCLKSRSFYDNRDRCYKMSPSTMNNIFLKLNEKLNGTNNYVSDTSHYELVKANPMFVGADVTHPPPDQKKTHPSVAAVCASFDKMGGKYHSVWRLQNGGIDRIDEFEDIMVEQLKFYQTKNANKLPSMIIYYRDGVAESQFKTFLEPEIDSMKRACQRLYAQNEAPKISVIVVNKRHHMRAFPINKNEGDGSKFNNILPGTVIDKDIVSPFFFQFFLASHSAIQGCTRPTKYTVILNECMIHADDMQALTYCLCHMYVRCNRSVSYPNCTYYAHWMAARGKIYIAGDDLDLENLQNEFQNRKLKEAVAEHHPMFFV